MKKTTLYLAALCGIILSLVNTASAQSSSPGTRSSPQARVLNPRADKAAADAPFGITPGGNFLFGADYLRWRTDYKGLRRGIDNRVNLFLQYSF